MGTSINCIHCNNYNCKLNKRWFIKRRVLLLGDRDCPLQAKYTRPDPPGPAPPKNCRRLLIKRME